MQVKKLFEMHNKEEENRLNTIKIESAKLKDFLLQKIESTCIQNKKMLRRFKQQVDKIEEKVNEERSKEDATIIQNTPAVPSAEMLNFFVFVCYKLLCFIIKMHEYCLFLDVRVTFV